MINIRLTNLISQDRLEVNKPLNDKNSRFLLNQMLILLVHEMNVDE